LVFPYININKTFTFEMKRELNVNAIEKVNKIYAAFKFETTGSFHTFLWRILVDKVRDGRICALTYLEAGPNQIGLADKDMGGYTPVPFSFLESVNTERRKAVINQLNRELFGIDAREAVEIVISTF
jgi:hypothetical protein